MPYHGEVSKYRIPASHAASRAARAASSLTATDRLPIGAQPKPTLVIGSSCCPMLTRCVRSTVSLFRGERDVLGSPDGSAAIPMFTGNLPSAKAREASSTSHL